MIKEEFKDVNFIFKLCNSSPVCSISPRPPFITCFPSPSTP